VVPRRKQQAAEEEPEQVDPTAPVPLAIPLLSVAGPLLGMCIAGYWASLDPDLERHFQDTTVLLIAALGFVFANALKRDPAVKNALAR